MPIGTTYTGSMAAAEPLVINSARLTEEYAAKVSPLVDTRRLKKGEGRTWREFLHNQLTAHTATERQEVDNPQEITGSRIQITPERVCVQTLITRSSRLRLSANVVAQFGRLAQQAISRKEDVDGLAMADSATTTLGTTGTTLMSGHISAASRRITSNTSEPYDGPIRTILHGFAIRDIEDQITAGVGTYPVGTGMTADVYRNNFRGMIGGSQLYEDGNVNIDATPDQHGMTFGKDAIILVRGQSPWMTHRDEPAIDGGSVSSWFWNEYAHGERSPGNWLYRHLTDGTAPTS